MTAAGHLIGFGITDHAYERALLRRRRRPSCPGNDQFRAIAEIYNGSDLIEHAHHGSHFIESVGGDALRSLVSCA